MAHHKEVDNFGIFFLKVLTLLGIGTVLISEGLSVFSLITPLGLSLAWCIYLSGIAYVFRTRLTYQYSALKKVTLKTVFSGLGLWERFVLGALTLNVFILLFVALLCPPNTWDSMTYHMSRVAHWAQQHSLAHYPTSILRQLYISPWAEYAILQPYVILGTDRFSNLVQWVGFIGALLAIIQITKELGGNKKTQLYATAFFATMPMALLQATSTQTDLISAFWVCCTVLFLIRRQIVFFSMCFALALFSKTSNALYLSPFCLWGLFLLKTDGKSFTYITQSVLILITVTTLVHSAHFYRNYASFGSIAGPAKEVKGMNNESIHPLMTISNVVRNYTLNLGTPSEAVNGQLTKIIRKAINSIGVDPDDKRFSFGSNYTFAISKTSTHEDHAPNPYQAWILLFVLPLFFFYASKNVRVYGLISLGSFYILCMFLRASPWNHRLHLPFFALMAPAFALALHYCKQNILRTVLQVSLVSAVVLSFYWSLCNYSKPVLHPKTHYPQSILSTSREDLYFYNRTYIKNAYLETLDVLRSAQCTHLGLRIGLDHWEYPFWAIAKLRSQELKITHDVGNNATSPLPCALFLSGEQTTPLLLNGVTYSVKKYFPGEFSHFTLLLPESTL